VSTLDEVAESIKTVLDGYDLGGLEITADTSFRQDLEFESIDIVVLGGKLGDRYGETINFPRFCPNWTSTGSSPSPLATSSTTSTRAAPPSRWTQRYEGQGGQAA